MVPKIHQECMATLLPFFSQNFGDRLSDYQFTPQSPDAFFRLQPWLDAQSMPSRRATGPLLLLQGDHDMFIKAHMTRQAVRNARTFGTPAEFRRYQGSDHITVLFDAGPEILQWMKSHLHR
jgi:pimeloyl-ACP methyl ester carboxylesterase